MLMRQVIIEIEVMSDNRDLKGRRTLLVLANDLKPDVYVDIPSRRESILSLKRRPDFKTLSY